MKTILFALILLAATYTTQAFNDSGLRLTSRIVEHYLSYHVENSLKKHYDGDNQWIKLYLRGMHGATIRTLDWREQSDASSWVVVWTWKDLDGSEISVRETATISNIDLPILKGVTYKIRIYAVIKTLIPTCFGSKLLYSNSSEEFVYTE